MAHKIPLKCNHDGCNEVPAYRVVGRYGTPAGDFCELHSSDEMDRLVNQEAMMDKMSTYNGGNSDDYDVII